MPRRSSASNNPQRRVQYCRKTIRTSSSNESSDTSTVSSPTTPLPSISQRRKTAIPQRSNAPGGPTRNKSSGPILKKVYQNDPKRDYYIPLSSFCRLVKEILTNYSIDGLRIQSAALLALQVAAETYLIQYFADANLLAQHGKRKTLLPRDLELLHRLRKNSGDQIILAMPNPDYASGSRIH